MTAPPPFTVIGGYLGAGKTTLLNNLLTQAGGLRVAVIVNDFGEVNIDASLIAGHDGDTISLANGCMCCSLSGGFAPAIAAILERAETLDAIVVEASGVAEPGKIAQYGQMFGLPLDGVLVVVDAEQIRMQALNKYVGDTVLRQLAQADLLLLNKIDLAPDLPAVRHWLSKRGVCGAGLRNCPLRRSAVDPGRPRTRSERLAAAGLAVRGPRPGPRPQAPRLDSRAQCARRAGRDRTLGGGGRWPDFPRQGLRATGGSAVAPPSPPARRAPLDARRRGAMGRGRGRDPHRLHRAAWRRGAAVAGRAADNWRFGGRLRPRGSARPPGALCDARIAAGGHPRDFSTL